MFNAQTQSLITILLDFEIFIGENPPNEGKRPSIFHNEFDHLENDLARQALFSSTNEFSVFEFRLSDDEESQLENLVIQLRLNYQQGLFFRVFENVTPSRDVNINRDYSKLQFTDYDCDSSFKVLQIVRRHFKRIAVVLDPKLKKCFKYSQ